MLQRMASLWLTAANNRQKLDRCRSENDYFAEQLSEDLEELTFLRSMVEYLEVSDDSHDLWSLAEKTLPLLNETVKAECLSLLLAPEDIDPMDAIPTICVGPKPIVDSLQTRIVQWFGESAQQQPVVKNRLASAPEGAMLAAGFASSFLCRWHRAAGNRDGCLP